MFSTEDTIVAVATPPGRGGIGIVRLSGPRSPAIALELTSHTDPFVPRHATLTLVRDAADDPPAARADAGPAIDQAVVTYFPAPASYTGEDVVEISAHGSPVVLSRIVTMAMAAGARLANPGEFTLRAYLHGRIDLMQAEAVADLIDAVTPLQARAAFDQVQGTLTSQIAAIDALLFDLIARLEASIDFPDEGYHFVAPTEIVTKLDTLEHRIATLLADARRGRMIREGLQVVIVGPPNVGKSTLFNALVGAPRAIVTDVPGTTRDLVSETIDLAGLKVLLVDTAGLRETADLIESEGIARTEGAARTADLVIDVRDATAAEQPGHERQVLATKALVVVNKADLAEAEVRSANAIKVSAKTGQGLELLRRAIVTALDIEPRADRPAVTNLRHIELLERVLGALTRAKTALADDERLPEELVLADLQEARAALDEVVGRRTPDDVLAHIFERFCVGK